MTKLSTTPEEVRRASESGFVKAVKYYPAGATTNSDSGVTSMERAFPALEGSKVVLGPQEAQVATLLNGVVRDGKQTAMASFKQLSDVELAAVMTFTRNAWGNKAEDNIVQPKEVLASRK